MSTRLRLYQSPAVEVEDRPAPTARIRLAELLPLVATAQKMNYLWLKDFLDDEVGVTEDLHDVLQSFRGCRPKAG